MHWQADLVALVSAALFVLALKLGLQIHGGISPFAAALIAGIAYVNLVALHILLRPRASRQAPALKATPRRRPRPAQQSVQPVILPQPENAAPDVESRPAPQPSVSRISVAVTNNRPLQPQENGFEHLQSLVAELARITPGPKAATPDPDAVQAETATAWAQYAATRAMRTNVISAQPNARQGTGGTEVSAFALELSDALSFDRLTIYLEPIQQIEFDRPRHYEVSVRFKDAAGLEMAHDRVMAAAREAGMLARVDAAILPRAARIAQHFQLRGRDTEILSHVHGDSLPDQQFRAEVTAATIAADGAALVLSFDQSDVRNFGPIHWDILNTIAEMGLTFAIESVTDLDMDFEILKARGFNFVKLDADVLIEGLPAAGGIIASADVCRHFSTAGLGLIVNHIDDEHALARILGFGVLFGQGALFGSKRAVRADILTSASAASAA